MSESRAATEQEQEWARKAGLVVAMDALKDLDVEDMSYKRIVHKVLEAFSAVDNLQRKAEQKLSETHGVRVMVWVDVRHIVASALCSHCMNPDWVGDEGYAAFADGSIVLHARSELEGALDCEQFGDHLAEDMLKEFKLDDEHDDEEDHDGTH